MKLWIKIALIIIALAIIAGVAGYLYVNKPHRNVADEKAAFEISPSDLLNAYTVDENAANKKYLDITGIVSGQLSLVEKSDSQVVIVFAVREGMFGDEGVRCTMNNDFAADAEKLIPPANVRVKGICKGYNQVDVIFDNCIIEK